MSLVATVFAWLVAELFLSAILWFMYVALRRLKLNAAGRYTFLRLGLGSIVFLPWLSFDWIRSQSGQQGPIQVFHGALPLVHISRVVGLASKSMTWLATILVMLWLLAATWRLVLLITSSIKLNRLAASSEDHSRFSSVSVRLVDEPLPPATFGLIKPLILLPRQIMASLSAKELQMIMEHETCHIARFDYLAHLVKAVVHALLIHSPFMAKLARVFVEDMELSCDALVLARGHKAKDYGALLFRLASELGPRRDLVYSGLFVSNSFISRRILAMKKGNKQSGRALAMAAAAFFTLVLGPTVASLGLESSVHNVLEASTEATPEAYAFEAKLTTGDNKNYSVSGFGRLDHGRRDVQLGDILLQIETQPNQKGWRFAATLTQQSTGKVLVKNTVVTDNRGAQITAGSNPTSGPNDLKYFTLNLRPGSSSKPTATFTTEARKSDTMTLNFREPTDLKDVIKTIAQASGKAIILDHSVDAKVTAYSDGPLPKHEAYLALLAALKEVNLRAVDVGKAIRIVRDTKVGP